MKSYDALIFDMDGTLWDAVDSYCRVWNVTFAEMGFDITIDRKGLVECMGMTIGDIFSRLVTIPVDKERFLRLLDRNEELLMPVLGGILYPGVREWLPKLAARYPLFMASNCGSLGLINFLSYTGLTRYFTDTITYGQTLRGKDYNIKLLANRHSLSNPIYIGDTNGDCIASHAAGVEMMHAAYGFGTAPEAAHRADSFEEVARFFLSSSPTPDK